MKNNGDKTRCKEKISKGLSIEKKQKLEIINKLIPSKPKLEGLLEGLLVNLWRI